VEDDTDIAPPRRRLPWWNIALFLATVATTVLSGAAFAGWSGGGVDGLVLAGLSYSAAILAILFAHEMGHYLLARAWRVDSTFPFFLPIYIPGSLNFGTLGALIRLRSAIPSRDAVLDIGAAGPISGALVAIPLYAWGLAHSRVHALAERAPAGSDSLWGMLQGWMQGEPLAGGNGSLVFGDSLVTAGVQWLVLGTLPPGHDVIVHPVALAAWLGLFVTTLNLLPLGQLDGGHVTYAWLGERRALLLSRLVSAGLLVAGIFVSFNWLVWWVLTRAVIGLRHPPAVHDAPIGPGRRAVAILSLVLFLGTFVPVPFRL
jgi:membrane-associated protease RseP (regulator of RpoE activity)